MRFEVGWLLVLLTACEGSKTTASAPPGVMQQRLERERAVVAEMVQAAHRQAPFECPSELINEVLGERDGKVLLTSELGLGGLLGAAQDAEPGNPVVRVLNSSKVSALRLHAADEDAAILAVSALQDARERSPFWAVAHFEQLNLPQPEGAEFKPGVALGWTTLFRFGESTPLCSARFEARSRVEVAQRPGETAEQALSEDFARQVKEAVAASVRTLSRRLSP